MSESCRSSPSLSCRERQHSIRAGLYRKTASNVHSARVSNVNVVCASYVHSAMSYNEGAARVCKRVQLRTIR
jgi:hypothetical protein